MFKSIKYVWLENIQNLYRIYCIAKYELLADMRDSKFGLFWNFASPAIQVLTYWLIFGIAWSRKPIGGIDYLPWLVVGYAAWWFIQPCIQSGCSAVFSKTDVITKMKFPVSVLPATVCALSLIHIYIIVDKNYDNIYEVRDIHTLDLMFVSDILVTDYSSVIFEYGFIGKAFSRIEAQNKFRIR